MVKAVMGVFPENSLPKEGGLAYLSLLKGDFFFFVSLDVVALLSPLIPGVSCFCKNKGLHKNRERNREFARWQI